jgi:hypothetical protein
MAFTNGRVGGRFAPGNPGGPGNPHAKQVNQLRAALYAAVTPDDIRQIATVLLTRAKDGDVRAIKELFDRLIGRAVQSIHLDGAADLLLSAVLDVLADHPDLKARLVANLKELKDG